MKISKRIVLFVMLVFLTVQTGCAGVPMRIDSSPKRPIDTTKGRVIEDQSCGFELFLLLPIRVNGRQERAYQNLIKAAKGDYIADLEINEEWRYTLFLGTKYCTNLRATAYPYIKEK